MEEYIAKTKGMVLPKNIKQIGDLDSDRRVYIEDYAYSFIKELSINNDEEGQVGLLFGHAYEAEEEDGPKKYIFIKGALLALNASVYEGRVAFTEETWASLNPMKNMYFQEMELLGWFLVSDVISVEKNKSIEKVHMDTFGADKLLFYICKGEDAEDCYFEMDGALSALDGYVIYFEKNPEMQNYMASTKEQRVHTDADDVASKRYRQVLREDKAEEKVKGQLNIMYALSAILVVLVLAIGVGRLKESKKAELEVTKANDILEENQVGADVAPIQDETLNVEYANGNLEPTTALVEQEESSEEATTEEPTTEEVTTEEPTTEEVTEEPTTEEPTRKVYVIQPGDTLSGILVREYGEATNKLLNELLELNGITDGGNSINIGDEIILP